MMSPRASRLIVNRTCTSPEAPYRSISLTSGLSNQAMGGAQDAFVAKIAGCDIVLAPDRGDLRVQYRERVILVNATNCPWNATVERFELDHNYQSRHGLSDSEHNIHDRREYRLRANRLYLGKRRSVRNYAGGLSTAAPSVVSLSPNAGGGIAQTFTATYATANPGGAPIDRVYFLMNTIVNGTGGCLVEYSPATNSFRLINNDGISWSAPATAGNRCHLSNSQCSLNASRPVRGLRLPEPAH